MNGKIQKNDKSILKRKWNNRENGNIIIDDDNDDNDDDGDGNIKQQGYQTNGGKH